MRIWNETQMQMRWTKIPSRQINEFLKKTHHSQSTILPNNDKAVVFGLYIDFLCTYKYCMHVIIAEKDL